MKILYSDKHIEISENNARCKYYICHGGKEREGFLAIGHDDKIYYYASETEDEDDTQPESIMEAFEASSEYHQLIFHKFLITVPEYQQEKYYFYNTEKRRWKTTKELQREKQKALDEKLNICRKFQDHLKEAQEKLAELEEGVKLQKEIVKEAKNEVKKFDDDRVIQKLLNNF